MIRRNLVLSLKALLLMGIMLAAILSLPGCGFSSAGTGSMGGRGGSGGSGNPGDGSATTDGATPDVGDGSVGTGGAIGGTGGTVGGTGGALGGTGGTGGLGGGKLGSTQCSDGIDNDGDGKIDLQDPECVSPLDNDESSFATGIPGDNVDPCKQDCFFDGNSGMGDDGCNWELKCDPANTGAGAAASCPYDPTAHNCPTTQSPKCLQTCRSVTPNGCDCFGCCVVPGVSHPIRLDPSCTAANFNDPSLCPICTQQTTCANTCGKCQLCVGKTTLDPSCAGTDGGTPTPTCPTGQTVCGTDATVCPGGTMCVTGCCVPWIF